MDNEFLHGLILSYNKILKEITTFKDELKFIKSEIEYLTKNMASSVIDLRKKTGGKLKNNINLKLKADDENKKIKGKNEHLIENNSIYLCTQLQQAESKTLKKTPIVVKKKNIQKKGKYATNNFKRKQRKKAVCNNFFDACINSIEKNNFFIDLGN